MGEDFKYSEEQKNGIYNKYLRPLKLKISQILLYDTKSATIFLYEYNEIIENTPDSELLNKITELELKLEEYEKGQGKQKSFEDKSRTIIQQIEDLTATCEQLNIEDFDQEFSTLMMRYRENFKNYSFEDKDSIEGRMYELQAKLIMRKVKENYPDEIEISEEDETGLMIYMNRELSRIQQNKNPKAKSYIERVKYNLMGGPKALHNSEIWKLLSYAQREKFIGEEQKDGRIPVSNQTNALAIVKDKKRVSFIQRISNIFRKEPQLPLQVDDLDKITIDWLAQHIPESMLMKIEEGRLKKEGINPKSKYLPDSKMAIYDFFARPLNYTEKYNCFEFEDKDGSKNKIRISRFGMTFVPIDLDKENINRMSKEIRLTNKCNNTTKSILNYAIFLDDIFETDFSSKLGHDYKKFIQNPKYSLKNIMLGNNWYSYNDEDFSAKSKLFKKFLKSYISMVEDCQETEEDFRRNEEDNRRGFYERNSFKDDLKITPRNDDMPKIIQAQQELGQSNEQKGEEQGG